MIRANDGLVQVETFRFFLFFFCPKKVEARSVSMCP
jgi:hypothetical protein